MTKEQLLEKLRDDLSKHLSEAARGVTQELHYDVDKGALEHGTGEESKDVKEFMSLISGVSDLLVLVCEPGSTLVLRDCEVSLIPF